MLPTSVQQSLSFFPFFRVPNDELEDYRNFLRLKHDILNFRSQGFCTKVLFHRAFFKNFVPSHLAIVPRS